MKGEFIEDSKKKEGRRENGWNVQGITEEGRGGGGRPAFYEGKSHKKEDWILQNIQRIMKEGGSVNLQKFHRKGKGGGKVNFIEGYNLIRRKGTFLGNSQDREGGKKF